MASTVTILGDQGTASTTAAGTAAESAASAPSSAAISAKKDKCVKDLEFLMDANMDPLDQFDKFMEDVCPTLDLRMPSKFSLLHSAACSEDFTCRDS